MRINHNIASLNTYRQLSTNGTNSQRSLEKLSSGLRINRAGDDAAGLAISEKMRGQIRGLEQASRNAQDGISLIQTAEGALTETHSILQRMRELATQAANGTNTDTDRGEIQGEINQLTSEINRIANTTEFNTKSLLNGSMGIFGNGKTISDLTKSGGITNASVDPSASAAAGTYTVSVVENKNAEIVDSHSDFTDASIDMDSKVELDGGLYEIRIDQKDGKIIDSSSASAPTGDTELLFSEGNNAPVTIHTNSSLGDDTYTVNIKKDQIAQEFSSDIGLEFADVSSVASGDYTIETSRVFSSAATAVTDSSSTGLVADEVVSGFRVSQDATAAEIAEFNDASSISISMATGDAGELEITFSSSESGVDAVTVTVKDADSGARAIKLGALEFDVDVAALVDGVDFGDGTNAVVISDATYDGGQIDIAEGSIYDQVTVTKNGYTDTATAVSANTDTVTAMTFDLMDGNGGFTMNITGDDFVAGRTENVNVQSEYTITMENSSSDVVGEEVTLNANDLSTNADVENIDLGKGVYVDFDLGKLTEADTSSTYTINFTVDTAATNVAEVINVETGNRAAGTNAISLDYVSDSSKAATVDLGKGIKVTYIKDTLDGLSDMDEKAITFAVAEKESDFDLTIKNGGEGLQTVNILAGQEAIFDNGVSVETDDNLAEGDLATIDVDNDLVDKSVELQIGANHGQSMSMDISDMSAAAIKISGGEGNAGETVLSQDGAKALYTKTKDVTNGTTSEGTEYALDVSSYENASGAIDVINDALEAVSAERSKLGAFQNRLEHTINNLGTSAENLTAAESRIRDVDMAKEMMEFTKNNILNQAAQAMLAQANQQPQGVLQLLR